MRHFSCDLCGKTLNPGADTRFVVRVESYSVAAPVEITEGDLDQDHIEAMAEMLEALEESSDARAAKPASTGGKSEHDLCGACHRKFLADPLGREQKRKLHFSKN